MSSQGCHPLVPLLIVVVLFVCCPLRSGLAEIASAGVGRRQNELLAPARHLDDVWMVATDEKEKEETKEMATMATEAESESDLFSSRQSPSSSASSGRSFGQLFQPVRANLRPVLTLFTSPQIAFNTLLNRIVAVSRALLEAVLV